MDKIYLAGSMYNRTDEEIGVWRAELMNGLCLDFDVIDPSSFYNYKHQFHKTEREIKEWEVQRIADCRLFIVNLDHVNDSVGTHYELATVDAINRYTDKNIFVLGLGNPEGIHPWILDSIHRIESTTDGLIEYILYYFG